MKKHLINKSYKMMKSFPHIFSFRPQYDLCKIKWEFNPQDPDFNPKLSIPHGDDYYPTYHSLKLNVDTGYIYTARSSSFYGKLTKKELKRLHNDKGFQNVRDAALKYRLSDSKIQKQKYDTYIIELECEINRKRIYR